MTTPNFTPDFRFFEDFRSQTCQPAKNTMITVDSENVEIEIDSCVDGGTETVTFDSETWDKIVEFVNRTRENADRVTWKEFHDNDNDGWAE